MATYHDYMRKLSQIDGDIAAELKKRLYNSSSPARGYVGQYANEITDNEWYAVQQYHIPMLFSELEDKERIAATSMILNAEYMRDLQRAKTSCSKYTGDELIFQNESIREACQNSELINYSRLVRTENSNLFRVDENWVIGDSRVKQCFYHWLDDCFKDKRRNIRIDPSVLSISQPTRMVIEMQIHPPVRNWWKNLKIYRGKPGGSIYKLVGSDPKLIQDYYDYNVYHVRKLETYVSRDNSGNLSMLMEELSEYINLVNPNEKYVLGRMIHLDTDAPIGTSYEQSTLNHIDLAECFYQDELADQRMSTPLHIQKVVTKDRTHILRVNDVPFSSVIKFAYAFFKSKQLVDEWKENEFI